MSRILKAYSRDIFYISENFIKVDFPYKDEETTPKTTPKTIPKTALKTTPKNLNQTQNQILTLIKDDAEITQKEIAENIGITLRAVKLSMKNMADYGVIKREGTSRKGYWRVL